MLSMDQGEEAEVDHVPRCAVLVLHEIQSHGNMRVTVVAAEVVLWGNGVTGLFSFLGLNGKHVVTALYLPSCAYTPRRHHALPCPKRWLR